jgi:hypothetical protein
MASTMVESVQSGLVPYCCSMDYAKRYDPSWQEYLESVRLLLLMAKRQRFASQTIIRDIPDESMIEILNFVDGPTLGMLSCTSKSWNHHSSKEEYWQRCIRQKFSITVESLRSKDGRPFPAKEVYRTCHERLLDILKGDIFHSTRKPTGMVIPRRFASF